jgi:hypothetical protein
MQGSLRIDGDGNVGWHRNDTNKHKMFDGLQCWCCSGGANGKRWRKRPSRAMLRALAQGKMVRYYPPGWLHLTNGLPYRAPPGLSRWKRTMQRRGAGSKMFNEL